MAGAGQKAGKPQGAPLPTGTWHSAQVGPPPRASETFGQDSRKEEIMQALGRNVGKDGVTLEGWRGG